jgi:acetylornithine deacetylase/succinyl-diaminopimelate desuccinylase-like protein
MVRELINQIEGKPMMCRMVPSIAALFLTATAALASDLPPAPQPPDAVKALALDVLKSLVETNTTHAHGSTAVAEQLAARVRAAGFAPQDVTLIAPADHPTKGNLVIRLHGQGKAKPLLFIGHLDVVEARKEDWSVDPFLLTAKDGYLYGRGTLDMKGDDAALVTNLMRFKQEGFVPERDIVVALTADEEAEGDANGVQWLLREHRDLIDADLVFNPDAGGGFSTGDRRLYMGLETSEKVFVTFGLEVTNKGGHSSLPEPDNAIYRLAAGLGRIARLNFPVRLNATTKAYFSEMATMQSGQKQRDMIAVTQPTLDPAAIKRLEASIFYNALLHTTCVATKIDGGHAENALPQRAHALIQCRMLPDDTQASVQATLVKTLADPAIKVSVVTPAAPGPESIPTPAIMRKVGAVVASMWPKVPLVPDMDTGASDSIFTRGAGIPSFGITGLFTDIDDNRTHGRDERIPIDGFYQDVEFTYRLMKTLSAAE